MNDVKITAVITENIGFRIWILLFTAITAPRIKPTIRASKVTRMVTLRPLIIKRQRSCTISFVKTKVSYSLQDFLLSFAIYTDHPSVHLWFLAVLMWFMLLYPLFRWLCLSNRRMIALLIFCIAIYFVEWQMAPERNYFFLFTLNYYIV